MRLACPESNGCECVCASQSSLQAQLAAKAPPSAHDIACYALLLTIAGEVPTAQYLTDALKDWACGPTTPRGDARTLALLCVLLGVLRRGEDVSAVAAAAASGPAHADGPVSTPLALAAFGSVLLSGGSPGRARAVAGTVSSLTHPTLPVETASDGDTPLVARCVPLPPYHSCCPRFMFAMV